MKANPKEAFTQAAGHPPWGITTFEMNHSGENVEGAALKRIRVDVPPGLAANPQAPMPKCAEAQFKANSCPPSSEVGTTELNAIAEEAGVTVPLNELKGKVYNLQPPSGLPLDFGIDVEATRGLTAPVQLFLEGHVAWYSDYHEYFEINNVPEERRNRSPDNQTPRVGETEDAEVETQLQRPRRRQLPDDPERVLVDHDLPPGTRIVFAAKSRTSETHTPVGVTAAATCRSNRRRRSRPNNSASSDKPDGATTVVTVPQNVNPTGINTADIKDAHVTLPEGLTLNPSAAHGLEACTRRQIGIGTT